MPVSPLRIGWQQLKIMLVLWERGRVTAWEITEALSGEKRVAHSTVQTLLRQLEKKGLVAHDVDDRTFVYRPLVNGEHFRVEAAHDLLEQLFDDSPAELLAHLLAHDQLTPDEREQIWAAIDAWTKRSGARRNRNSKD